MSATFGCPPGSIDARFPRLIEKAPWPVMVRARLERTFHPKRRDAWGDHTADAQYPRELLFSTLFELMSQVGCGVRRSVHDAYQAAEHIATSVGAGDRKLARIEPTTVLELGRYSAQESRAGMAALESTPPSPRPGDGVKSLDGNTLAATEPRMKELGLRRAGAWPGKAVGVYEPARNLMGDLVPGADGHAQERALLPALVETVQRGEGWVGDRNFCGTDFLVGIAARGAYFIVREHEPVRFTPQGAMRDGGRVETGPVAEPRGGLTRAGQATLAVRRIAGRLDQPTRAGDTPLSILPNRPPEAAPATGVARGSRGRWRLETAFPILATAWTREIDPRAYPKAARVGFAVAVGTDNVLATGKAARAKGHGADTIEREFSDSSLAAELAAVAAGMAVALPAQDWPGFPPLPLTEFVTCLLPLAQNVRLARLRNPPRGRKKPQPKRSDDPTHPPVSTARLSAARK